jgi:hypothetical protein
MSDPPRSSSHSVFAESGGGRSSSRTSSGGPDHSVRVLDGGQLDSSGTHTAFGQNERKGSRLQDEEDVSTDDEEQKSQCPSHECSTSAVITASTTERVRSLTLLLCVLSPDGRRDSEDNVRQGLLGNGSSSGGGDGGGDEDPMQRTHGMSTSTANTMLFVFTVCNLLTYFDRGSIGVCLDAIMKPEPDGCQYHSAPTLILSSSACVPAGIDILSSDSSCCGYYFF